MSTIQKEIEKISNKLGSIPDRVVAEKLGCSIATVREARIKRGIGMFKEPKTRIYKKEIPKEITDKFGQVPDSVLAKEMGISPNYFCRLKKDMGFETKPPVLRLRDHHDFIINNKPRAVVEKLGCSLVAVYKYKQKYKKEEA